MIANLTPYPAMKHSRVGWLGDVPEHWEIRTIKSLFREKNTRSRDGKEMLLSLTRKDGIVPHSEVSTRPISASDLSKYKLCAPDDLVMNRMQAWSGMFAVSGYCGLVSPDYSVFEPTTKSAIHVQFFERLFKTPRFVDQFAKRSKGIGSGFNRLYTPDFGSIHALLPPSAEQAAIVRFLDQADRRIRRYIRAKEQLIELLEEHKKAIIHQAVTGQIDVRTGQSYSVYKDSGVEWMGKVPEHWNVRRIKTMFRLRTEKSGVAHGRELLSIYTHIGVRPRRELEEKGNKASTTDNYWIVKKGDLIFNKLLAWMGAVGVSDYDGVTSPAYDILMPIVNLASGYYHLLFRTQRYMMQFKKRSRGIMDMRLRLYFDQLGQIPVPVPSRDEQQAIVKFLNKVILGTNHITNRTRQQIAILLEYRTRLIADVVTGKLDVRTAAAGLPEINPLRAEDDPEDGKEVNRR